MKPVQIIGMMDSPFVRRVVLSAELLGVPFTHRSVSVIRHLERFKEINPLLKVPNVICDDGTHLVESSQIIEYFEFTARPARSLLPEGLEMRRRCAHLIGYALIAAEKSVQHLYEVELRETHLHFSSWIARVRGQLEVAWQVLDDAIARSPFSEAEDGPWLLGDAFTQADLTLAVAFGFNQFAQPGLTDASHFPHVARHSARAERRAEFRRWPVDHEL